MLETQMRGGSRKIRLLSLFIAAAYTESNQTVKPVKK